MSRGKSRSMSGSAVRSSLRKRPRCSSLSQRVDVREAGEVADDRGHARAPPPPRRQRGAGRCRPAHLGRHLARQLEQVAVQQEEARQAELADHPQLLGQAGLRPGASRRPRVALGEPVCAGFGELRVRLGVLGARVGVAEVRREVEAQPLREPPGLGHGAGVVGEALGHGLGRGQGVGGVAAALGLALVEGRAQADRHERVLQAGARAAVGVHVAGCHRRHAQPPASSASQRLRRRSFRAKGRWSSILRWSGPNVRSRRRAAAAAPTWSPRSTARATAPSRAQPERQTSPWAWLLEGVVGAHRS